jgi:hypothetical protein
MELTRSVWYSTQNNVPQDAVYKYRMAGFQNRIRIRMDPH